MVRFPVILVALAAWIVAGCAGDTDATFPNNTDVTSHDDTKVPPGADSPYPPDEDTDPAVEPDIYVEPDNGPEDPCADYTWIQAGKVYMCTFECGGQGTCTPTFTNENGECGIQCELPFYEFARDLPRVGTDGFIFRPEACPATCTPVE